MSAANALQKAIYERLRDDPSLQMLIGPGRVHDRLVERAALPHVIFGPAETRDWSTASEPGEEHLVTLEAWSDDNGKRSAQAIVDAIKAALHDTALVLERHRLVNLRLTGSVVKRQPKSTRHQAIVKLRAVTEPSGF